MVEVEVGGKLIEIERRSASHESRVTIYGKSKRSSGVREVSK